MALADLIVESPIKAAMLLIGAWLALLLIALAAADARARRGR